MDVAAAAATATATATRRWVEWEEVVVSNDRGRRLVHYYLRGAPSDGGEERELAVVGRERSPRHMSYTVQGRFLRSLAAAGNGAAAPSPSRSPAAAESAPRKWRSRREVVDWLSSLVSGVTQWKPLLVNFLCQSCKLAFGNIEKKKQQHEPKSDCNSEPSSMANRFRGSYGDNDADFVDVAASKDVSTTSLVRKKSKDFTWLGPAWHCQKRLKHYRSFCRRGITISVHGFVYIMSEQKKRLIAYIEDLYEDSNAVDMVTVRWFDKVDEVGAELPSDVYDWEIFFSHGLQDLNVECIDGLAAVLSAQHFDKFQSGTRRSYWQPYLCRRQIDNDDVKPFDITQLQGYWNQELVRTMFNAASSLKVRFKVTKGGAGSDGVEKRKYDTLNDSSNLQRILPSGGFGSDSLASEHSLQKQLYPGCYAEVLSQDSGIRGCWFRCFILRRHGDKIKVRYEDLQDADESGNLEEWVLLTRIAKPDQLGIRIFGRPMVRPNHIQHGKSPCSFDIGAVVDAWWNNGWWEGIVLRQGNGGRLHVYFPGEKRVADFDVEDLRHSVEWLDDRWNPLKERKDIACQLPPTSECETRGFTKLVCQASDERCDGKSLGNKMSQDQKRVLADLTNALKFDNLKWRARKRSRRSSPKRQSDTSSGSSSQGDLEESSPCGINSVPDEVCKSTGEPIFIGLPVPVSSLVMSR